MPQWAYQLEQHGKDFVVIVENVPEQCPRCYALMQMYDVEFYDDGTIGSTLDLQGLADKRQLVPVEVVCPQGHVVCQARAKVVHLHEFSPSRAQESPDVGRIRVIYALLQKRLLGLNVPSTGLIESSFLPGRLAQADVWVSDEADVSPSATLFPPVLIGGKSQIGEHATCGPFVILINSTVDAGENVSMLGKVDDRVLTLGM